MDWQTDKPRRLGMKTLADRLQNGPERRTVEIYDQVLGHLAVDPHDRKMEELREELDQLMLRMDRIICKAQGNEPFDCDKQPEVQNRDPWANIGKGLV